MKEFFEIQLVKLKAGRVAYFFAVLVLSTLFFNTSSTAVAQSESPVVEIKVGKELKKLFALSALPETVSIPLVSNTGEVLSVIEQQLITVTDKQSLYGVLIPTQGGFFGTIVDQSSSTPTYYQLSPKVADSKTGLVKRTATLVQEATELQGSDLVRPSQCGEPHEHDLEQDLSKLSQRVAKMVSVTPQSGWRELELFVVSSSEFSANRSEETITAQVLSTVAAANLFFEPLELKIALSGVQILRADSDPYANALKRLDADEILNVARAEWRGRTEVKRDLVAVFGTSNYNRYSTTNTINATNIFGLAYTKTVCTNQDYSVLFASQGSLDSKGELSLAATLAHEIGHTLGMGHDNRLYNQVPSLMHSTFTINPAGFSDNSTKEYLSYAGSGLSGGSCLSSIPTPILIAFEGGAFEVIEIKEGEKFSRNIKVTGISAIVSANTLIPGALFNSENAEFTFQPNFELASKKSGARIVTQRLTAKVLDGREITKELVFKVSDVNRAPLIRALKVTRGAGLKLSFLVSDPDGDSLLLSKETLKSVSRLAGRKNLRFDGKKVSFTWAPQTKSRAKASFSALEFRLSDEQGLSSTTKIQLN